MLSNKKILFLGASPQQLGPIKRAANAGYRIVTCDNVPGNPGHALAHASYDVSTTDFDGVLDIATREKVDGVVCSGSDVGAPTAAFVAQRMGLPGNPLKSVETLTNKLEFRQYQTRKGLTSARFIHFTSAEAATPAQVISRATSSLEFPVVVKPVDASGGKGIGKVDRPEALPEAITRALRYTRSGVVIVENFVPKRDYQICGEGFLVDGQIVFCAFANEHFTNGITVPVGESFPSVFDDHLVEKATGVLQEIMTDLRMSIGAFNFDLFFTPQNDVFVVEIGPRSGGNRMPEAIQYAYGVDMIGSAIDVSLGKPVLMDGQPSGSYATYSLHARTSGVLQKIHFDEFIESRIVDRLMFVAEGDRVRCFDAGSHMLGNLILHFENYSEMLATLDNMERHIKVVVRKDH